MADQKYIKVDPETGNLSYLDKEEGQKVPAMPDDADLCFISFRAEKDITVKGGQSKPGFSFTCRQSPECVKKNAKAEAGKKALRDAKATLGQTVTAQDKIIRDADKVIGDDKKSADGKKQARSQKGAAEAEKKKANDKIEELDRLIAGVHYCRIGYLFKGGNGEPKSGALTDDEIKEKKIEHIFCRCHIVEVPPVPK